MFNALRISLSDGQSYENVMVVDPSKFEQYGIIPLFEEWTFAIIAKNRRIIANAFNVKMIHLHKLRLKVSGALPFDRLVMDGNIVYEGGHIIPLEQYKDFDIPDIYNVNYGMLSQLSFTVRDGTFITSDYNVSTLTYPDDAVTMQGVAKSFKPGNLLQPHSLKSGKSIHQRIQRS